MLLWSCGKFEASNICDPCSSLFCFSFFASPALHCVAFLSLSLAPVHWELCNYYKENGTFCTGKWSFLLIPHSTNRMASVSSAFVALPRPEPQNTSWSSVIGSLQREERLGMRSKKSKVSWVMESMGGQGLKAGGGLLVRGRASPLDQYLRITIALYSRVRGCRDVTLRSCCGAAQANTVQLSEGPVWIAWFFKFIIYSQM